MANQDPLCLFFRSSPSEFKDTVEASDTDRIPILISSVLESSSTHSLVESSSEFSVSNLAFDVDMSDFSLGHTDPGTTDEFLIRCPGRHMISSSLRNSEVRKFDSTDDSTDSSWLCSTSISLFFESGRNDKSEGFSDNLFSFA